MSILTIILFFIYTWGLGFTAAKLIRAIKEADSILERNLMRVGIGLGILPILGVLLNLLHIPLDWKIFLALSFAFPLYYVLKKAGKKELSIPKFNFKITKSGLILFIVSLLFFITLFMYASGAFNYSYLEDDDPWSYANSIKYISIEKTAYNPTEFNFDYIYPYPPGYSIIMAVLHQTSQSLLWTMKFFNALIISLGIIFFYFFAKEFIGDKNKALFSTFILAAIPCFLSHFIWSHALIVILFLPAFYCLERIKHDKKWVWIASLVIAGICVIEVTEAIKFGVMFIIYWATKVVINKNIQKEVFLAGLLGFLTSFLWWGSMLAKLGIRGILGSKAATAALGVTKPLLSFFNMKGTATRLYTFNDFFIAKAQNMINNPVGVGIIISILLAVALVYIFMRYKDSFSKEKVWIPISLFWLIFTFLGIHGGTRIPIALFSFRFWMLFAIPVSLLASEGAWFLFDLGKKFKISKITILAVIIIGVVLTSGYQKYAVNTAVWPPGAEWGSMEEVQGYSWLETLPANTKVFGLCSESSSSHIIGFDKFDCVWCKDEINFRKEAINKTAEQLDSWLRGKDYSYFIVDSRCVTAFGINETNGFIQKMASSNLFEVAHQTEGMILMKTV